MGALGERASTLLYGKLPQVCPAGCLNSENHMADSKNRNIVIVEDEQEMIDLIELILSRRGFDVIGANGGAQGLKAIREYKPDLVLLDLMMPEMDGWQVYQQLKGDPSTENIPVIVVTAKAQNIDKVLGLHIAKVDDYIPKPFSLEELVSRIEKVLKRSNQAQKAAS